MTRSDRPAALRTNSQRPVPIEIAIHGREMRERRRLREQLERQAMAGVVGIQQVTRERQQLAPILRHPVSFTE
jgi:hypothetical protein